MMVTSYIIRRLKILLILLSLVSQSCFVQTKYDNHLIEKEETSLKNLRQLTFSG